MVMMVLTEATFVTAGFGDFFIGAMRWLGVVMARWCQRRWCRPCGNGDKWLKRRGKVGYGEERRWDMEMMKMIRFGMYDWVG